MEGATGDLERMKNLGPISAARLRAVGVESADELRRVGAVEAYLRLRRAFPTETTHIMLYALYGALVDLRWYELGDEVTAALRDAAARGL